MTQSVWPIAVFGGAAFAQFAILAAALLTGAVLADYIIYIFLSLSLTKVGCLAHMGWPRYKDVR